MTESDLDKIESELDVELPADYREFISNYPPLLLCEDNRSPVWELSNSADHLIELNRLVRRMHDFDWPEEYLVIGESGCGDYYAIDMDDDESSVYLWNHEQGDFSKEEEVDSLLEFAGQVLISRERVAQILAERGGLFRRLKYWWVNR